MLFELQETTRIGARIDGEDMQLVHGNGYNHNWVLKYNPEPIIVAGAVVYDSGSGRIMEVLTTGLQFSGRKSPDACLAEKGDLSPYRDVAFVWRPQHFPDSPNHAGFPSQCSGLARSMPTTIYRFGVRQGLRSRQ